MEDDATGASSTTPSLVADENLGNSPDAQDAATSPPPRSKRRLKGESGRRLDTGESDGATASGGTTVQLGPRCRYLESWFAKQHEIEASHVDVLSQMNEGDVAEKMRQIEDWALSLGIEEERELKRTGELGVLTPIGSSAAAT